MPPTGHSESAPWAISIRRSHNRVRPDPQATSAQPPVEVGG
jgi:hypothetical protein